MIKQAIIYNLLIMMLILGSTPGRLSSQTSDRNLYLQQFDRQLLHWGFFLGISRFDFSSSPTLAGINPEGVNVLSVEPASTFSVGVLGDLRLHEHISLRLEPSVHFSKRTLYFSNQPTREDRIRILNSNYVDIPLLVKFNSVRTNNIRPYIAGGLGIIFNLNSEQDNQDDNSDGVFRQKRTNFNWQAEFGVEIYLRYFKLTPAIKGVFVIDNEVIPDNQQSNQDINGGWTRNIDYLKTSAFVFSLKFQ